MDLLYGAEDSRRNGLSDQPDVIAFIRERGEARKDARQQTTMDAAGNLFGFLSSVAVTDVGRKRKRNEDAVACFPEAGVFCVADGMGGEDAGDVASRATVEGIASALRGPLSERALAESRTKATLVTDALRTVSAHIQRQARERGRGLSGSTVVVLLFDAVQPRTALALHAGDSRLYRYREGALVQLTRDHSLAEEAGFKNRRDFPRMFRGIVTRGVGIRDSLVLEETVVDVQESDLFLLCSDGLTSMVSDRQLRTLLHTGEGTPLEDMARALLAKANEAGGEDNIAIVLVRVNALVSRPIDTRASVPADNDILAERDETETADTALPTEESAKTDPSHEKSSEVETMRRRPAGPLSRWIRKVAGKES